MKGYEASCITEVRQQARNVAVANNNFGLGGKPLQIQARQQIVCSVPPSRTNYRVHVIAFEHLFEFLDAAFGRARKIEIVGKSGFVVNDLVSHLPQRFAASFKFIPLERACGSNNADRISRTQSVGLDARSWT